MVFAENDILPVRVMGLHSLTYCERLYYLEEVENILIADERVYAGRNFHDDIRVDNLDIGRIETFEYTSEKLGLTGKVDRLQKRDGIWVPYEYKIGRSKTSGTVKEAWESDAIQLTAYAMLIEESSGRFLEEGRIKYRRDNTLVKIQFNDEIRQKTLATINRAKAIRNEVHRPPVAENANLCVRCSLAPVCLPEENRSLEINDYDAARLFVPHREKETIHITGYKTRVSKKGETIEVIKIDDEDKPAKTKLPVNEIESIILHGSISISAQLIAFLAFQKIPIHWFTMGGNYIGGLNSNAGTPQRKIRQYEALTDGKTRFYLTKKLAIGKCETQLRYILRATRKKERAISQIDAIEGMRQNIKKMGSADNIDSIRGYEGTIARIYHQIIPTLLITDVPAHMYPDGRSKRPPKDRYNAIQSFLYSLLYKSVFQAIIAVGLDPDFGFYHTPRSSASPLALDVMELFRTPICDIPLVGSVNRLSWDIKEDFDVTSEKVWLSESGRKKAITIFETRLNDTWKHPILGYSLTYYRMIEMETRFLEKEWSDQAGMFATARMR
jgi:CRISPR-associated protein Cas1